jgi:hypothetical protein
VLQFSGGISLGVSIRDFLQLEGAFAGDGVMHSAAKVEKLFSLGVRRCEGFRQFVPGAEVLLNGLGQTQKALQVRAGHF